MMRNICGYWGSIQHSVLPRKVPEDAGKIGCIVMNSDPFTLGHRHLAEYAWKKVDYLHIFVVEEDRSFFSFKDRYEIVRRGTYDLENVCVIRSGKLIASTETFPSYFNREDVSVGEPCH